MVEVKDLSVCCGLRARPYGCIQIKEKRQLTWLVDGQQPASHKGMDEDCKSGQTYIEKM